MWEPRQGVRCIPRTINPPPPPGPNGMPRSACNPFGQISGMEVGEGMEGSFAQVFVL